MQDGGSLISCVSVGSITLHAERHTHPLHCFILAANLLLFVECREKPEPRFVNADESPSKVAGRVGGGKLHRRLFKRILSAFSVKGGGVELHYSCLVCCSFMCLSHLRYE